MKATIDPVLNNVFNTLSLISVLFGLCCCFCVIYGSLRLSVAQRRLLQALREHAPSTYTRLHNPIWRDGINPWHLAAFLRDTECDESAALSQVKNDCRQAWWWFTRGFVGFIASVVCSLIIA